MSYNISTFKVKEISNLWIPMSALRGRRGLTIFRMGAEMKDIKITGLGEHVSFRGVLGMPQNDLLLVADVNLSGEGSGADYEEVFLPILEQSLGILEFIAVWEGGDSITRVRFEDGEKVKDEEVQF